MFYFSPNNQHFRDKVRENTYPFNFVYIVTDIGIETSIFISFKRFASVNLNYQF